MLWLQTLLIEVPWWLSFWTPDLQNLCLRWQSFCAIMLGCVFLQQVWCQQWVKWQEERGRGECEGYVLGRESRRPEPKERRTKERDRSAVSLYWTESSHSKASEQQFPLWFETFKNCDWTWVLVPCPQHTADRRWKKTTSWVLNQPSFHSKRK